MEQEKWRKKATTTAPTNDTLTKFSAELLALKLLWMRN